MNSVRKLRERASLAVEGSAIVGALGTILVALLAAGVTEPLVSLPSARVVETLVIGWGSGFLICYAWMAHWLRGQDR